MTTRTALITGGAGFIGSHLADALVARGWIVTILDNFAPMYSRAMKERNVAQAMRRGARLIEGDITREEDVGRAFDAARPGVVVHLAAWAGVRPSIANPSLYAHVNVVGTQRVLDEVMKRGGASAVRRVVVASSSSVYGDAEKAPFAEDHDVSRPISPYAATKVATELVCRTAAHLHGLPITALRFFTVYGPRQRPDLAIAKFMAAMSRDETIEVFGDGTTSRDYTFVEDIIDGVLRAIDQPMVGDGVSGHGSGGYRCYNLGSDRPVTLAELVAAIEKATGKRARIERKGMQAGDVRRTWADLRRAEAELGYRPRTGLEEGLARQWEWWRGEGGG